MAIRHSFDQELNQVLLKGDSSVKELILNRPKKLNSLNYHMLSVMTKELKSYENDPQVKLVLLKGNGKAFCAGGDVIGCYTYTVTGHWSFGASFYKKQLILDYIIATYRKPVVAIINGIVMGGGAGLSMNARFKIVTENTVFAMPEAAIGLFPDVGASYFLSRLPGYLGEYLGLTGAKLNGAETVEFGLATHFVLSKNLQLLENVIYKAAPSDASTISEIIDNFMHKASPKSDSWYGRLEIINKCFSRKTVEEILSALEGEAKNGAGEWIDRAIKSMKSACPSSLKIFLRSIREGRSQGLEQCLIRDYTIFCNILRRTISSDFFEGARALLLEKDKKPKWEPSKLEQVTEEMVGCYLSKIDEDDWEFLQLPARSNRAVAMRPKL